MKKIISILLAIVLAFSVMPITALADDINVDSEVLFSQPDYSAYNSILELVEALDEKEYTKESIDRVKAKVVDKATLETQEQVNNAVAEIATAYAELEKNSFTVNFAIIDSNEDEVYERYTYLYGETINLNVDNGETPYKWVVSTKDGDTKIDSSECDFSLIADKSCSILVYTDTKPEEKKVLKQVKFLSFSGKLVHIEYTEDSSNIEMPEAPILPFYYFTEWVQLNETTYQARYLSDSICDGNHHRFTTMVAKATCEENGYVIFQCSCGEAYRTDYTRPIGHNFDSESKYCLNGCGKYNPNIEDEGSEEIESTPTEPTTQPSQNVVVESGFDEGGYNNVVIAP